MEGEAAAGDFHDWEVLPNSDSPVFNSDEPSRALEGIEGDSGGVIRSDYFSLLVSDNRYVNSEESEDGSMESDNPSWVDPGPEQARFDRSNSGRDFWSDSGSDRSESRKLGQFEANSQVGFEGMDEIQAEKRGFGDFSSDSSGDRSEDSRLRTFDENSGLGSVENVKNQVGLGGLDEIQTQDKHSGDGLNLEVEGGKDHTNGSGEGERSEGLGGNETVAVSAELKSGGEGERGRLVWWKVPFEFVRFCVFRVSPIWSLSVAAAVMGFIILRRRLYKMKPKSQTLQLKVAVDDKKVSQFMSRAARLNEVFSVVKRVPVVRPPSLPAAGLTPWPVLSLR